MLSRRTLAAGAAGLLPAGLARPSLAQCRAGTIYLTIDTGWGREAEAIAATMQRREVRATLFVANEPGWRGDTTLGPGNWADFWRARAADGHAFASHTWRHWYFTADAGPGQVRYASRRGEGTEILDGSAFCAELARPTDKLRQIAPAARILPLWRAPGGRTTPNALRLGTACGLRHQGWTARGFLGDELDSAKYPNSALLGQALRNIRDGEVLIMHWGVRSRREPFGEVFEDLVAGLQAKGFCFALLPAQGIGAA
ncbi:polysaccharide deacetylase family protein [Pseudoroseomonas globiformis]|uniref:Chitooligosaccharide deacetylase n=1 Tax=Teichococcus globiformis TaxID=2307229 RepID=A0ABV7GBF0_9PROT